MLKTHLVSLRYAKSPRPAVSLAYRQMPIDKRQARTQSRYALVPDIQLDDYRCNAVIDWITISVELGRITQQQWLADAFSGFGRRPYIAAIDPGAGDESSRFKIKVQEPDLAELDRIVAAVGRKFGLESEPAVLAMEVSVDFTPKKPSDDARARLVGVLTRSLAPPLSIFDEKKGMPRHVWGKENRWARLQESKRSSRDPYRFGVVDTHSPPPADSTVYFGAKDADVMVRVMDKVVDRQNTFAGTAEALPPEKQRCRVEVTLQQAALRDLGIHKMRDVTSFRFSVLQGRYFQFKLATVPVETAGPVSTYRERKRLEKFLATGVSGLAMMDIAISNHKVAIRPRVQSDLHARGKRLPPRPRTAGGPYGTAIAYERLCKKVQVALANLSRKVKHHDDEDGL